MRKLFFALVTVLTLAACQPAHAASQVNLSGLSEEQIAQLQLKAAQMKSAQEKAEEVEKIVTPEKAAAWADFADQISDTIVRVASGLGVAVNDFVKTPVGKLVMFMIIWMVIGKQLFGVFLVWLAGGIALALFRNLQKLTRDQDFEMRKVPFFIFWEKERNVVVKQRAITTEGAGLVRFLIWLCYLVIPVMATVVSYNMLGL